MDYAGSLVSRIQFVDANASDVTNVCLRRLPRPLRRKPAFWAESILRIRPSRRTASYPLLASPSPFRPDEPYVRTCTWFPNTPVRSHRRDKAGRPLVRGSQRGDRCTPLLRTQERSTKTIADIRDGIAYVADRANSGHSADRCGGVGTAGRNGAPSSSRARCLTRVKARSARQHQNWTCQ